MAVGIFSALTKFLAHAADALIQCTSLICQLILSLGRNRISPKIPPFPPCVCVLCLLADVVIFGYIWTHIWIYLDIYLDTKNISGFIWTNIWIYLDTYLDTKIISGLSRIDLVNVPEEAVRECTNSGPRFYTGPTSSTIHSLYWRTSNVERAIKL